MNKWKKEGRLLVIDPDPAIHMILRHMLKNTASEIVATCRGEEALETIQKEPFDALFCEMIMPEMSGIDLLRELRAQGRNIPCVMVARLADKDNILRSLRVGALDFVQKPFNDNLVKLSVQNALTIEFYLAITRSKLVTSQTGTAHSRSDIAEALVPSRRSS